MAAGTLDASHDEMEVRTPYLRIAVRSARNVTTDYALLRRAAPFATRLRRPQIIVVLAGHSRVEEGGRRAWLRRGQLAVSEGGEHRDGTAAYVGTSAKQLLVEWDPSVFGAPHDRPFEVATVSDADCVRLELAARRALSPASTALGTSEVLSILRSIGVPLAHPAEPPSVPLPPGVAELNDVLAAMVSALHRSPAIEDLAAQLRWNARRIHRGLKTISRRFVMPWTDWRSLLYAHRILAATRLASAPGATTEIIAELTGFRSPTSLCHAFAKTGLPSPGALARAARRDRLDGWTDIA